jgi:hypothetical protein
MNKPRLNLSVDVYAIPFHQTKARPPRLLEGDFMNLILRINGIYARSVFMPIMDWCCYGCFCCLMLASASQIASAGLPDQAQGRSVLIQRIEQMPNMPSPFVMRDWQRVTCGYMDYIFDFEKRGEHLPLMHWQDTNHTMIVLPAYVGNNDGTEGINYLAAVVSGSLVRLDMRAFRGHDWVALGTNFFNPKDGIFLDWPAGKSGGSFWYDVLPNVLF